jgi:hypothetical protein
VLQIPDTYFVASCPKRLLSPQHYSQQIHDHMGTYSTNFGDQVVFGFHKKKFQVTVPLSPSSNVGILRSATSVHPRSDSAADSVRLPPENTAQDSFKGGSEVSPPVKIFPTETVCSPTVPNNSVNPPGTSSEESDEPDRPNVIPFDLANDQEDTNLTNQDDVTYSLDASAELMRRHLQLGHLPFANIRLMAARKEIPSRLANC